MATAGVLPLHKPDESILPVAGSFSPERARAALSRQLVIEHERPRLALKAGEPPRLPAGWRRRPAPRPAARVRYAHRRAGPHLRAQRQDSYHD
eukprot:13190769-Heterocapsa_arctica.AAC.1